MGDYIERQAAVEAIKIDLEYSNDHIRALERVPSADVVPYSINDDGTMTITVPKGMKVGRVLVQEDGTQLGGLYYAD